MQVSVVNFQLVVDSSSFMRLEAEYYNSNSLLSTGCFTGESVADFVQYGTSKELNEDKKGFPTLRLNEFDSFFISEPQKYCEKISVDTFETLSLKKGDVLICRTNGNPKLVGKAAIVPKNYDYAFASYLYRVRPDHKKILPTTLVAYLNSKSGRTEIEKYLMVSNQANFSPAKFREILIPKFGDKLQQLISECIWTSFNKHEQSCNRYSKAQTILLKELGLVDWKPRNSLWFIKDHSNVQQAKRIDAEFFQPQYEEIEDSIKSYPGGYSVIGQEFEPVKSTFEIDNEKQYQYVEIGSINVSNGEITPNDVVGAKLPTNAKRALKRNDVIISKVRTYRGAMTIVETNGYIGSGAFTVLRENGQINKETLLAFLHSKPLLAWSLKPNTGTSYPVILDEDISNLPIPLLPVETQTEIQKQVVASFGLRKQSKHLLECAKRAVEIAIEQDEGKATTWLKSAKNIMIAIPVSITQPDQLDDVH